MGRSLQLLNQLGGKFSSLLIPKCKFWLSSSPLSLLMAQSLLSRERLKQMPAVLVTTVVLIVKTRRITSATRHPNSNIMKCHVEYDIVVDVTEIEECEYVVITHCQEEHQQVYHNSHIVGHDSQVVGQYHSGHNGHGGYHKRAADPGHEHHCEDKKEMQCQKLPKENTRKIPKQECTKIVDTHYIETCEERIHTHCEETVEKSHHSTRVVGHESHKVAHGHHDGYGGY